MVKHTFLKVYLAFYQNLHERVKPMLTTCRCFSSSCSCNVAELRVELSFTPPRMKILALIFNFNGKFQKSIHEQLSESRPPPPPPPQKKNNNLKKQ